jgi:uncharacterized cysteine cluster protein YcgN (CxxCxxCC family)
VVKPTLVTNSIWITMNSCNFSRICSCVKLEGMALVWWAVVALPHSLYMPMTCCRRVMTETGLRVRYCVMITGHKIDAYKQANTLHQDSISRSLFRLTERTTAQRTGDFTECLLFDHYTTPSVMWLPQFCKKLLSTMFYSAGRGSRDTVHNFGSHLLLTLRHTLWQHNVGFKKWIWKKSLLIITFIRNGVAFVGATQLIACINPDVE